MNLWINFTPAQIAGRRIESLWRSHEAGHLTHREYADGYEHNKALCIAAMRMLGGGERDH